MPSKTYTRTPRLPRIVALIVSLAALGAVAGCSKVASRSLFVPGYADAFKKCSTLTDPQKTDCVRELDGRASRSQSVSGFFEERVRREETLRANEQEADRRQALCPTAQSLITRAIEQGKYGRAWKTKQDTTSCSNATDIARTYATELRRVSPSKIVAYADNTIADDYFDTITIMEWMDYAARGSFISDRGVKIVGNVSQQFDDYLVITSAYADESVTVLHLDKKRYVRAGALTMVIGRFRELAPFENRLGTRRDLPVFELLYAYTGY